MSNRLPRFASGSTTLAITCIALVHCVQLADRDGGSRSKGWGTAEQVHHEGAAPAVAVDHAGNVAAVWSQSDGLWARRCAPEGGCSDADLISHSAATVDVPEDATLAMDAVGNAVAVWSQAFDQNNIFSNRYTPSSGWGVPQRLDDRSGEAFSPHVSMGADGIAVAVWAQFDGVRDDVWSSRYAPREGWSSARTIGTADATRVSGPRVAVGVDGHAMAVWAQSDDTRFSIWSTRYTPSSGWADAAQIETSNAGDARAPQVAVDPQGDAVAVWHQSNGARSDIWANRYTPSGDWGEAERIEGEEEGDALNPQLGVDSHGAALVVWVQLDVSPGIWSNRYAPSNGWGTAARIDGDEAREPRIAVERTGDAVAVWKKLDGGGDHIWSSWYSAGSAWGAAAAIDGDAIGAANSPRVSMNPSGDAVAVWTVFGGSGAGIWSNRWE